MLELRDIIKIYPSGGENVKALKGVSLRFRNSEFVSILGPSGCGKTTMLNIIGGLDKYTAGDLVINGISTKKYNDRSWDNYRNHTIGFVFQSYNLIPHQTVLQNVELALTLSGVSKGERRRRAKEALAKVGLSSQLKKRPAQMSGGQMQRVAIARAIVNNPSIILADEPTGALDSETSVQVMDILKEIAKDRLVIMVTHNPELAEQYSTRIIRMKDGVVMGDSDPLSDEEVAELTEKDRRDAEEAKKRRKKVAAMSFATAFGLSLKNLFTKKGRTLLTSFAGSIGIIGIAMIYAVSQGTSDYIAEVQETTLSSYPLQITTETADMTSIFSGFVSSARGEGIAEGVSYEVHELEVMKSIFGGIGSNDLQSFKKYLDSNESRYADDVNAIKYSYGITPVLYTRDVTGKLLKANPSSMTAYMTGGMNSPFFSMSIFSELIDNRELIEPQYEMLAGRWPESYDEMLLVLSSRDRMSDMITYAIGLHNPDSLNNAIAKMMRGEEFELESTETLSWTYDELMQLEFKLVGACDTYRYNEEYSLWEDMKGNSEYMEKVYANSPTIKVVGIACPGSDNATGASTGFCYLPSLIEYVINHANESEIVRMQLADISTNVFSGKRFGEEEEEKGIDFTEMISVDSEMISSAFGTSISQEAITAMVSDYLNKILASANIDTSGAKKDFEDNFVLLAKDLLETFTQEHTDEDGDVKVSLGDAQEFVTAYMESETALKIIGGLEEKYGLPEGTLANTYEPLLSALVRGYIMSEVTGNGIGEDNVVPGDGSEEDKDSEDTGASGGEDNSGDSSGAADTAGDTESSGSTVTPGTESGYTDEDGEEVIFIPSDHSGEESISADPIRTPEVTSSAYSVPVVISAPAAKTYAESAGEEEIIIIFEDNPAEEPADSEETEESAGSGESGSADETDKTGDSAEESGSTGGFELPDIGFADIDVESVVDEIMKIKVPVDPENISSVIDGFVGSTVFVSVQNTIAPIMIASEVRDQLTYSAGVYLAQLMQRVMGSITVDGEKIANAFSFDMSEEEMMRLFSALSTQPVSATAESNLNDLGYADISMPVSINIYLHDFEGKERFISFIDGYNDSMKENGADEKVIRYTDITGLLMSSVTTIIDAITYVLIAFVAISLVVSSIMIGVITLISVQERTKEIGILRAIGASKKNVSSMFNAETMIIGFTSGAIGVIFTYIVCIPVNIILHNITGIDTLSAHLPWPVAVILVIISMLLTLFAGIIPSRSASKKDPVIALRSE